MAATRITLVPNGTRRGGQVVVRPRTWDDLVWLARARLFPNTTAPVHALRIFLPSGGEVRDLEAIETSETLYVSQGEDFLGASERQRTENPETGLYHGLLTVSVLEARDLLSKDFVGRSNPFCALHFQHKSFKSKPATNAVNPHWTEVFEFDVRRPLHHDIVQVELFSKRFGTAIFEHFLGQVTISLADLEEHKVIDKWFPLEKRSERSRVRGTVHIKIQFQCRGRSQTVDPNSPAEVHLPRHGAMGMTSARIRSVLHQIAGFDKGILREMWENAAHVSNLGRDAASRQEARDWNEEFQQWIDASYATPEDARLREERINGLSKTFMTEAVRLAQWIIDEAYCATEDRTLHFPVREGELVPDKIIHRNTLFLFAKQGGHHCSMDHAMKALAHELNGTLHLLACHNRDLHLPLLGHITYRGWRVLVSSVLPISSDLLLYGTEDGGVTVRDEVPEFSLSIAMVADQLNLKPHRVGDLETGKILCLPADARGHLGKDGRYYLHDVARLFPPTTPLPELPSSHLVRLLRPELVKVNPCSLSSDAFSAFGRDGSSALNAEVRDATRRLEEKVIPTFSAWLESEWGHESDFPRSLGGLDFKGILHQEGINLRYLGHVRRHVEAPELRALLFLEMVVRVFRRVLFEAWRSLGPGSTESDFRTTAASHFTLLLGNKPSAVTFWRTTLRRSLTTWFPGCFSLREDVEPFDFHEYRSGDLACHLFHRAQIATGVLFKPEPQSRFHWNAQDLQTCFPLLDSDIGKIVCHSKGTGILHTAETLALRGDFHAAEAIYHLQLETRTLMNENVGMVRTLCTLARLCMMEGKEGRLVDAERYLLKARAICENTPSEDRCTAELAECMGDLYKQTGKRLQAEQSYGRCVTIMEALLGEDHPEMARILDKYASVDDQPARATEFRRRAEDIREKNTPTWLRR